VRGPVPNLTLPQTTISKVESSFDIKGVVQNSPNNLTLYNSAVVLRILGGTLGKLNLMGVNIEKEVEFTHRSICLEGLQGGLFQSRE